MSEEKPLRPYQLQLVREASAAYNSGILAILMQSTTGSGKTRTAAFIVEQYTKTSRQVLWLVHRDELLMQAALVFAEHRIPHSLICNSRSETAIKCQEVREFGDNFVRKDSFLVIASIWTIARRIGKLPWLNPKQIIADECHLSLSETWRTVIGAFPGSRLLGLSATPKRLDKQSFAREDGGLYDHIIKGPSVRTLISAGNLAKYKLYAPPIKLNEVNVKKKGGDFDPKDLEQELDSPVIYGDVVEHYKTLSQGKPAIAFCPTVLSSEKLAAKFNEAGIKATHIDGETDDSLRRNALAALGRGEIDVVTSVSILVEGTDIPYASTAILLRRTESLALYLQAVGRVLRPHPKKDHALILDFVGVAQIHGMPCAERNWALKPEQARRLVKGEVEEVKIKTCDNCYHIHEPAPVCPECGNQYPVKVRRPMKQVNGRLIEISVEEEALMQMQRDNKAERAKARTHKELVELAMKRGYKNPDFWARQILTGRSKKQNGNRNFRP